MKLIKLLKTIRKINEPTRPEQGAWITLTRESRPSLKVLVRGDNGQVMFKNHGKESICPITLDDLLAVDWRVFIEYTKD